MDFSSSNLTVADAEQLKHKGNECFKHKLYNKSIYFYTKSLELEPENSIVWANRAQAYLKVHKYEKAYMDADGALERDPNNNKALFRRAIALHKLGLHKKAFEDARRCLHASPNNKEIVDLCKALENKEDADVVELTVFQRPEALQSRKPLVKKELKEKPKS